MDLPSDSTSDLDEDDSAQLYNSANLILELCEQAASRLTSILLLVYFSKSSIWRPAPHPFRSDSLKDLAGAAITKFSLTNEPDELDRAISLLIQPQSHWSNVRVCSHFDT